MPLQLGALARLALPLSALMLAGCAVGHGAAGPAPVSAEAAELRSEVREIITQARDRVYPALVNISVVTVQYWDGKEVKGRSTGSGTIISPEGYVVTNQHVTAGGESFICTLADKREIPATLVGEDPLTDIAVLKLDADALGSAELPVAEFGDSSKLQVGMYVMAMGSPFSLSRSVTLGIVSNTQRVFATETAGSDVEEMELESGQRTGLFTRWIQHDALINPGNSGGPLVDLTGQIVGINELGGSSMGFAIPSNLAREVVDDLIEHGEVPRAWIGISVTTVKRTGIDHGALISSVDESSPAGAGGVEAGDILLALNGEETNVRFIEEAPLLLKRIADLPIGGTAELTVQRRGGEVETLSVTTQRMQEDLGDQRALRAWGLTVRDITPKMARDWRLPSTEGVLVTSVRSGGPASQGEPPLDWSDVLVSIEGEPVHDLEDAVRLYTEVINRDPLPERVLIGFDRSGKNHVTLIKPRSDNPQDPPRELPRAWLGAATQPVMGRLADRLGLDNIRGYRVTRVYPGTTAAESELLEGDLIIALNGNSVAPRSMEDAGSLTRAVRQLDVGVEATLEVLRDGETREVVFLTEGAPLQPSQVLRERDTDFEMTVRDVTFYDRDAARWDASEIGALVEQVDTGGWADSAGIRGGDLIQQVDDFAIEDVRDYRAAMKSIGEERPERVMFVVLRQARKRVLFAEPEWAPADVEEESD